MIALSNEELERVIAEARRLQPQTGVQREAVRRALPAVCFCSTLSERFFLAAVLSHFVKVRLLVENCRLALTANDYAEGVALARTAFSFCSSSAAGILKKTLGKLAAAEQGAGSSSQGARNGEGAKSGSFSRMCSKW